MRVAVIFLACVAALVSAQYNQDDALQSKGLPAPLRSARFQRLPSARPAIPAQLGLANQRIRRPITFRARGAEDTIGTGPASFPPIKPLRSNLPTAAVTATATATPTTPLAAQIKPVNEEPEEDVRNRDSLREHDGQDEEGEPSDEIAESHEESEENIPRAVPNYGTLGSRIPSNTGPSGQSVQYRPISGPGTAVGRANAIPATPAPAPVQYRPAQKPNKLRKTAEEPFKQQVKPPTKPIKPPQEYDSRGRKPVAQIIRRYRNDNPDGSITWGFENDDGSYKEEIIGVDCITRGKYGYIDPDGIRREYTYETGIKCDEEQREEEEENGFVDYQENKLVLPDGKTIDLSSMGKKQARRPRLIRRN